MNNFTEKLKAFLHDPIDKCLDIPMHIYRAKRYAEALNISGVEEAEGPDHIASCMERSLLPKEKLFQEFNQIKHPLSKGEIQISEDLKKSEIFEKINQILTEIGSEISTYESQKKFFYLWRNLQERIFEEVENEDWAKYLPLFPADTRIPDHSIWEHLKIASAIFAFDGMQNNSLFLFTIGPVQSFISQARKTQDFYMGSFILSFLIFNAMEEIIDRYGPTNIIYPDLYKQPFIDWWIKKNFWFEPVGFDKNFLQIPTIPNRFVAILPTSDKNEISRLAEKMKEGIRSLVNEIKNDILNELNINVNEAGGKKITSQISEFPEIYWVALPWRVGDRDVLFDDLKDYFEESKIKNYNGLWNFTLKNGEFPPNIGLLYELLYTALEKSMGARKNTRAFTQSAVEEKGRKCSVCGERDVIFFKESRNKKKFIGFFEKESEISSKGSIPLVDLTDNFNIPLKYLTEGEGLCAVCFIKRTFGVYLEKEVSDAFKDLSFPSTAEVACADFKQRAVEKAKEEYWSYQNKLKNILNEKLQKSSPLPKMKHLFERNKINIDGSLFFEENLREKYFEKEFNIIISTEEIKNLKEFIKNITDKTGEPNPYYAILHLDGDNMGRWLSGELLPEIMQAYNTEVWVKLPNNFKNELKDKLSRKLLTPAIHASISTALRNYAIEFVRKIVEEEHIGKLIYAGGDDVLALVNLKDLFDVMQKLRWAFSGQIKFENSAIKVDLENKTGFVEKEKRYLLTMGANATASMGVVIAHYKTPLQIVIKKVFDMEKEAKKDGKDNFAICLMKRSGEERVMKSKWRYEDKNLIKNLKKLEKYFDESKDKFISKGFIQKTASTFERLKDEKGNLSISSGIFYNQILRILHRSYNGPKESEKDFVKEVFNRMKEFFLDIGGNFNNFLNFCILVTFLHGKGD